MACSFRLSNNIISSNFALKNKYLLVLLAHNRHFCSKDSDARTGNSNLSDSSSKEKQDEKPKETPVKRKALQFKRAPITDEMKEAAKQKLMSLLSGIKVTSEGPVKSTSNLSLARAVKRISKRERLKQIEDAKMTPEKEINMAVKTVASTFKEDSEKVESELTEKLTTLNLTKSTASEKIESTGDIPLIDNEVNENLMSSVEEVAATISENPIPPRSELTKRLMRMSLDQKVASDEKKSMRSVIEGMVIKQKRKKSVKQPQAFSPEGGTQEIETRMSVRKTPVPKRIENVNLFAAAPLNIFTPGSEMKPDSTNTFWQKLQERELHLLTHFAPANAFEEMIMWTEQGKHWKLPIDNETEMGEEENIGFHEHVFLEGHLKGFPTKGPIRHFMELVCVGLSKNPYITVERKLENIEWFRNYFQEKEEILRDSGALD